jgi:hypothetical protein
MLVEIPVSVGELVDKVTILEIKLEFAKDPSQSQNIQKELIYLTDKLGQISFPTFHYETLKSVNRRLWEIEDLIRKQEDLRDFGKEFIMYARLIYMYNDTRANIKREINMATGSEIVEEKIFSQ